MRKRTQARELALQFLYEVDVLGGVEHAERLDSFLDRMTRGGEVRSFARELVVGVLEQLDELDKTIGKVAHNWRMDRMAYVDRNVLRIAAWELLFRKDIPRKVTINEAIDLVKRFGTEESGAFINGILDHMEDAAS